MALKFAGESNQPERDKPKSSGSALDELRNLLGQPTQGGHQDAMPPEMIDEIIDKVQDLPDDEVAQLVATHKRMDELVDSWHKVRDEPGNTEALMKFVSLVKQTTLTLPPMQLGSIISAGIAAIVELERREHENGKGE